jgi:uncharacterized membrane protein
MKDWLHVVSLNVVTIIQVMALLVVAWGTLVAFVDTLRAVFRPSPGNDFHEGYVRYARWLIAGLTFQLAADIVQTAIAPSWNELGHLAAIAAIRAFINFFLEHDLAQQERSRRLSRTAPGDAAPGASPPGGPAP